MKLRLLTPKSRLLTKPLKPEECDAVSGEAWSQILGIICNIREAALQ